MEKSKLRARDESITALSGEEFEIGRVARSASFMTTKLIASISAANESPRTSALPNDHSSLWPLTSPTMMELAVRRGAMEVEKPGGHDEAGGT